MILNGAQSAAAGFAASLISQPVDMSPAPQGYITMHAPAATVAQPVDMYPARPDPAQVPPGAIAQPIDPHRGIPHSGRRATQPQPPSATSDGPYTDQPPPVVDSSEVPQRSPYRCQAGRDVQDTISRCQRTDTHENVGHKHGNNIFWAIAAAALVAFVIGATTRNTSFSTDENSVTEQTLLDQGPQLPVIYPDGSLSVRGFTRDGWPIVIDFQPQPGTVTQLEVTTGQGRHKHTEKMVLDPDGSHGRQIVRVAMPNTGSARNPVPAAYVVSSVPIAAFDTDHPQAAGLAPVKIYGIGGGPHAVGSVAIEQVAFTQTMPGARFSYFAKSEFNRARAQVQQLQRATDGTIQIQPVAEFFGSNLTVGPHGGVWPGAEASTQQRVFRLQVTAWFTNDDRSWVAALAPDLISQ
jgi:hypothetical protein